MVDKKKTIEVTADTTEVQAKIGDIKKATRREFDQMSRDAETTSKEVSAAFKKMGIRTEKDIKKSSDEARKNYEKIKNSGTASANDIKRAHNVMTAKIKANNRELNAGAGRLSKAFSGLKSQLVGIGVGIVAAGFAIKKAFDFAESGAKLKVQREAFNNYAKSVGGDGDDIIKKLKEVSRETVATSDLIDGAGKALLLGLDPNKIVDLLKIARASAKLTGESITQLFSDISLGTGRASKQILDNLGIQFSQAKASEAMAAALNKTVKELTDVERRQGNLNEVLRAGAPIIQGVGKDYDSQADSLARLRAKFKDYMDALAVFSLRMLPILENAFIRMRRSQLVLQRSIFQTLPLIAKMTDFLHITKNASATVEDATAQLNDEIAEQDKKLKATIESSRKMAQASSDEKDALTELKDVQDRDTSSTHTQTNIIKTIRQDSGPSDFTLRSARPQEPFVGPPTREDFFKNVQNIKRAEFARKFPGLATLKTGGDIPGYGGGDKVPALLEAGEHVIRKESVRKLGRAAAEAFNRGDVNSLISNLLRSRNVQKFAEGGAVKGGGGDSVNLNLRIGNKSFPTKTDKSTADSLIKTVRKTNIIYGRGDYPY